MKVHTGYQCIVVADETQMWCRRTLPTCDSHVGRWRRRGLGRGSLSPSTPGPVVYPRVTRRGEWSSTLDDTQESVVVVGTTGGRLPGDMACNTTVTGATGHLKCRWDVSPQTPNLSTVLDRLLFLSHSPPRPRVGVGNPRARDECLVTGPLPSYLNPKLVETRQKDGS